jgi:hypothetical protein
MPRTDTIERVEVHRVMYLRAQTRSRRLIDAKVRITRLDCTGFDPLVETIPRRQRRQPVAAVRLSRHFARAAVDVHHDDCAVQQLYRSMLILVSIVMSTAGVCPVC